MPGSGYPILALTLATVAAIGLLAAPDCCARDTADAAGGGLPEGTFGPLPPVLGGAPALRVALWITGLPGEPELYREMMRDFQRTTPDVQIVPAMQSWQEDTQQVIFHELRAETDPADVVLLRDEWLPQAADELLSLDTAVGSIVRRGYRDPVLDACRVDGVLRALPFCARTKCLFYRPALLHKLHLDPPRTWDELPAVAQKLTAEPGVWGFGLPGAPSPDGADILLVMLWAQGGRLVDDEGRLVVGQELLKALQLCVDLVHVAHATQPETCYWTQESLENQFLAGKLGMLIAGPHLARHLAMRRPKMDYAVAPLPEWQTRATRLSVDCLAVSARSPHPELALRFLRHATQDRYSAAMWRLGLVAAKTSAGRDGGSRGSSGLGTFVTSLEHARPAPARLWPHVWPYLADVLVEALTGRRSPEAALVDLLPPDIPSIVHLDKPAAEAEEETSEASPSEP
jgi:multiple sugar transport system substrate-binding protein